MANLTGGSFKRISPENIKVRKSSLNQLVDVIQEDVSGSATRRSYQVFVTGGVGPGVTSSLYQTIYDQDFTLQSSNPIFDITFGLNPVGTTVTSAKTSTDSAGKLLFPSQSLMMREKVDIYKQYASTLLGNADNSFFAPFDSTSTSTNPADNDRIDEALFISFKRLFARDRLKRETFAVRLNRTGSLSGHTVSGSFEASTLANSILNTYTGSNLNLTSELGNAIFTDLGAASNQRITFGGSVGEIVNSANTNEKVGLIFYDHGTVVLDMAKTFMSDQHMSGVIGGMRGGTMTTHTDVGPGAVVLGGGTMKPTGFRAGNPDATFIPDLLVSASIDDVLKHICTSRFQSGTFTAMTFQNVTSINSTLVFCHATADEFNYSSNPSFTNSEGRLRVVDIGQEDTQRSFVFPTTVGLHDEFGNLLAVAKMSRPIEKNDEKDITFRVRLDF